MKLVIADAREGLKHAVAKVLGATSRRCRVHWMRNALAHVPKGQHRMVAAALRQASSQPERAAAGQTWQQAADRLRVRWPKLASPMDESGHDVWAHLTFPSQHPAKLHSTNPLERLNKEVKRRADMAGNFPGEASIIRLIGTVLPEQNDEWQTGHRHMLLEAMARADDADTRCRTDAHSTQGRPTDGHLRSARISTSSTDGTPAADAARPSSGSVACRRPTTPRQLTGVELSSACIFATTSLKGRRDPR